MIFKKSKDNYSKRTKYDLVKQTKRENFRFLNENFALKNQTVLIGDSITEIFNWYELFYAFSKQSGQAIYNRGISGDTSDRLLERLYDNALNISPKNLVILIGTNDIGNVVPTDVTIDNIDKILAETKAHCPDANIILEAVYPVNKNMSAAAAAMVGVRKNEAIRNINQKISKLAEKHGCIWLDLTDKLSADNGNLNSKYCYDGLHLNVHGFKVVADSVIPLLK